MNDISASRVERAIKTIRSRNAISVEGFDVRQNLLLRRFGNMILLARGNPRRKNGVIDHSTGRKVLLEQLEEVLEARLRNHITRDNVVIMVSNGVDEIPTPSTFNKVMEEIGGFFPFLIPLNRGFLFPENLFTAKGLGNDG